MIPTVQQVYLGARSVLGDTKTTAGEVFTNTLLEPHLQTSYSELFRAMQQVQSPRLRCENYFDVPAFTGYVDPATMFITNMGEIESVEERGNVTEWAISAAVTGSGIATITSAATTLATGNQAVVYGIQGITEDINDIWTVTVNSTTSTQLNGCSATGTYTSGGVLSYSAEAFHAVSPLQRLSWVDRGPVDSFQNYAWEKDRLRFPPANNVRQIRVVYSLSGDAPTNASASLGIDDSLDFLKYRIAGLAGPSKGMMARAELYRNIAVGPRWESEGIEGGILDQLLNSGVRNLQRLPPSQRRSPGYGWNRRSSWRGLAW